MQHDTTFNRRINSLAPFQLMLLGQTLEAMQAWDTRQALKALRTIPGFEQPQTWLQAGGTSAGIALYASLYEKNLHRLDLHNLPTSHKEGPHFLRILQFTDLPEAAAHAGTTAQLRIYSNGQPCDWQYPIDVAKKLGWDHKQFKVVSLPE